jgi:DNA-binding CsgD family transcriptional regulator
MIAELNGQQSNEISERINKIISPMLIPKGNGVLLSFWTNDLNYIRIYPDQEFYDYIISSKMFLSSTVNHIRKINLNSDLTPNEFWCSDTLFQKYEKLSNTLNVIIPNTYVRVFNEGKLIFQFVKYKQKMPINLQKSQEIKTMATFMGMISETLVDYLPVLQDTQFSINARYRDSIVLNQGVDNLLLTDLEKKTLYWLSVGKTLEDIALMYENKPSSVKSRMSVVREKLNATTNIQAVAMALKYKLL